jgi:hypothetical protein
LLLILIGIIAKEYHELEIDQFYRNLRFKLTQTMSPELHNTRSELTLEILKSFKLFPSITNTSITINCLHDHQNCIHGQARRVVQRKVQLKML